MKISGQSVRCFLLLMMALLTSCLCTPALALEFEKLRAARYVDWDSFTCEDPPVAERYPHSARYGYIYFEASTSVETQFRGVLVRIGQGGERRNIVSVRWDPVAGSNCFLYRFKIRNRPLEVGLYEFEVFAENRSVGKVRFQIMPLAEACRAVKTEGFQTGFSVTVYPDDCLVDDWLGNGDFTNAVGIYHSLDANAVLELRLQGYSTWPDLYVLGKGWTIPRFFGAWTERTCHAAGLLLAPGTHLIVAGAGIVLDRAAGLQFSVNATRLEKACNVVAYRAPGPVEAAVDGSGCMLDVFWGPRHSAIVRLDIAVPRHLQIRVTSAEIDPVAFLLDPNFQDVAFDDDDDDGSTNSRLVASLRPGKWWLVVQPYFTENGKVQITLADISESPQDVITLFLHGLNSGPEAWERLDELEMRDIGGCSILRASSNGEGIEIERSSSSVGFRHCYIYRFGDRTVDGQSWPNGDGATYGQLASEVAEVVKFLEQQHDISTLMLVGHSRGGLAARAFLQEHSRSGPYRVGLLTLGTPHLGSPLGRIGYWLHQKQRVPSDEDCFYIPEKAVRFVFSPSTRYLSSDHDENGRLIWSAISDAIGRLNADVSRLATTMDAFVEVESSGLPLGKVDIFGFSVDLLGSLLGCLSRNGEEENELRSFVVKNLPAPWLEDTDGIVASESQRLSPLLAGIAHSVRHATFTLPRGVSHTEQTGQTYYIMRALLELENLLHGTGLYDHVADVSETSGTRSRRILASGGGGQNRPAKAHESHASEEQDRTLPQGAVGIDVQFAGRQTPAAAPGRVAGHQSGAGPSGARFTTRRADRKHFRYHVDLLRSGQRALEERVEAGKALAMRGTADATMALLESLDSGCCDGFSDELLSVMDKSLSTQSVTAMRKMISSGRVKNEALRGRLELLLLEAEKRLAGR